MSTLKQLLHLDDGEFPALRAQIEATPLPAPPAKKPVGWGRNMLAYLRALDVAAEPNIAPFVQTDWAARLADDWTHVNARWDNLTEATPREFERIIDSHVYGVHTLTAPLLSELAEIKAVTLVDWRQALRVHAEDELALSDAKAEVA